MHKAKEKGAMSYNFLSEHRFTHGSFRNVAILQRKKLFVGHTTFLSVLSRRNWGTSISKTTPTSIGRPHSFCLQNSSILQWFQQNRDKEPETRIFQKAHQKIQTPACEQKDPLQNKTINFGNTSRKFVFRQNKANQTTCAHTRKLSLLRFWYCTTCMEILQLDLDTSDNAERNVIDSLYMKMCVCRCVLHTDSAHWNGNPRSPSLGPK